MSCRNSDGDRGDGGFTFLECAVGAVIFSLIGLALASFCASSILGTTGAKEDARNSSLVTMADREIRASVSRIQPPFWGGGFSVDCDGESAAMPYLDGKKDSVLKICGTGKELQVESGTRPVSFRGIKLEKITLLGTESCPKGVAVAYAVGVRTFETKALFGAFPLEFTDE